VRRANSLLGFLGVILIVFALIASYLTGGRTTVDALYIALHGGLGLLALIAYLSTGVDNLRSFVGQRSTRYGANALLYSLAFIAVLGLLNYLSLRHNHRWDLSEAQVYSLSPQSSKVVAGLDKSLEMLAFVEGGANPPLEDLLRTYKEAGKQVTFRMVDPDRDPATAKEKKITQVPSIYIGYGDQSTVVTQPTEEAITNALIKVTRGSKTSVCVVGGHGEPDIDDQQTPKGFASLKEALENENYAVKKVLLANVDKVPDDCSLVVAAGPAKPYLENEIAALGSYLNAGGHLMLLLPPQKGNELKPLLADWGVTAGDDVVVDQVMRLFQGPAIGLEPITNTYGKHEITDQIRDMTSFPMTRSISAGETKPKRRVTELVKTSASSWAETDFAGLFEQHKVALDKGVDKQGPVSVAVAVEAMNGDGEGAKARLVVFGSNEFADNRNLGGSNYNQELILNSIAWLSGQSDLVSIRPRALRASRFQLSQDQGTVIFYVSVLLLPELLLIAGLTVWWRRSNA
jgi:ABC-type uncharacterized transport system involved in gliding motility auxiliary subunit